MKVQYVSISPTERAEELGCYALTPELLAATGARYSRNNEGLDSIASKIDFNNKDKSVDGIFKMLDYGHASIADMTPIALFIDGISQFAAYYLWTLSPTAGGQECSTRYIKMDESGLVDPEVLGIPNSIMNYYSGYNKKAFKTYHEALEIWTQISELHPELTKIPKNLLESNSEKDKKAVERMKRNFAFDRARVFIPLSASTGVMMIQSARAWAQISSHLQSHYLKELNILGAEIAEKMAIGAPRLLKHAKPKKEITDYLNHEREVCLISAKDVLVQKENYTLTYFDYGLSKLSKKEVIDSLKFRTNRYSPFGNELCRLAVKFGWRGISFGEIRDLNRHRTGTKYCPLIPLGFYGATDVLPTVNAKNKSYVEKIKTFFNNFNNDSKIIKFIMHDHPEYIYLTSLGHKYSFDHVTTADKFLYEMELRTGVGAHYKYAQHCHDVLELWYSKFPESKGLILEGTAEPE